VFAVEYFKALSLYKFTGAIKSHKIIQKLNFLFLWYWDGRWWEWQ